MAVIFLGSRRQNAISVRGSYWFIKGLERCDQAALDRLTGHVYGELRLIARRYMSNQREGNTLQTTTLVNEAYLRLVDVKNIDWQQRAQFFALSAQIMRRILVDAARARGSHKRGGGAVKIDRSWRALETDLWLRFQVGPSRDSDPNGPKMIYITTFGGSVWHGPAE